MYIIFSNTEDYQTSEVMDRLLFYGKEVKRYNENYTEEEKKELAEAMNRHSLLLEGNEDKLNDPIAIYHRRPNPHIIKQLLDRDFTEEDIQYPEYQPESVYFRVLKSNYLAHQNKFYEVVLNDPKYAICKIDYHLNKYDVLEKAVEAGLVIPPTLISGKKTEVSDFYERHNQNIITKSLYNILSPQGALEEGFMVRCYTQKVEDMEALPENFFPTLFQKNIEKKYEIRIFYLDEEIYSAAILSQKNEKSEQDFRSADRENPNRIVPYKLSEELKSQIIALMKSVGLNTGSIDFMMGVDGKCYFLEINPVGQYGFINAHCNFGISDAIAKKMIQIHES